MDDNKLRKILKEMGIQTTLPASWETYMQVKKKQLEPDMKQQTGSKLGKEYLKARYCQPACLTFMQTTSHKMLGWWLTTGIKIAGGNINDLRYAGDTL